MKHALLQCHCEALPKQSQQCHSEPFACHSEHSEESRFSTPNSELSTRYIHTYIHTYIHKTTLPLLFLLSIFTLMSLSNVSFAAISLTVTPSYPTCLTANTASGFTFQTQAAAAGGQVQFELFFDFNNNGIIDGDEWPICAQVLVDNETVGDDECLTPDADPSSPDITTNLDTGSAYLPVGNYIIRVQNSLAEVATAQLCVTAVSAPHTVTGTVYEQGTSTPVPNAFVDCEDVNTEDFISAAVTDSNGFYTLQIPTPGNVEICAEKYGYLETCSNVTVPPGGISNYNLHLIPTDTQITGTVKEYGTDDPVWGAEVEVEDENDEDSWTTTNINGNFSLPVLSGIEWEICAEKYGYLEICRDVTVPSGGISNYNLYLIPTDTHITGTVKEYGTATPIKGVEVSAETIDGKASGTVTDINGNFSLPVLSGIDWKICFEKYGYLEICRDVTVPSGGISNYNVSLTPLDVEITGTVTEYGTGNPLQGVDVWAETIDGKRSEAVTDINGNFSLPVLSGIEWRVSSDEPTGYFGSGTPENNYAPEITITPLPESSNIVNFIIHKETAWIEATVLDEYGEKPVKGALFSAFRINVDANVNPELWWLDNGGATTDASGKATVGLEAGDWRVSLCFNCHDRPVYVGGEQKEMVPPPQENVLNLTTGEHRGKTLKAYYADGVLVGRVFREDGRTPAPEGIGVSARSSNALNGAGQTPVGSTIHTFTVTDKDGYFRIPVLSGTWSLEASFWGRTSFPIEVTLITNGNDVIEPGETSTDINLIVPLEIWNEVCDDGIDNDGDGFADCNDPECCEDPVCIGNPACRVVFENILAQKATLDDVEVGGDYTSTLDFTSFEIVRITTGPFVGKGFSKGQCETTLDGTPYTGEWKGVTFLKPDEKRIYLKGAITGGITATVEGYLTESVPNSGIYDQYHATWQIGRLSINAVSKIINLNGVISYQSSSESSDTKLYIVQDNIETTPSGHYDPIPLNIVLTHLRVVSKDNPYYGEGFSIISYTSESGSGQGWTYDKTFSPGVVQLKGLFTSPFYGIVSATLDESALPRTLFLTIERIDLALPPLMADLEVRTWGPERVSPGQTVDYMVEYRNDGVSPAEDTVIVLELPSLAQYISSTNKGIYRWETHEAFWKLGTVIPGQRGVLSARVYFPWGLPQGVPQLTLAMYGTSSTEKDFFLNPDREPLFDLQEYLNYQPLVISPEDILTPEEFAEELVSDARLNDLHQYAIELGYSDRIATKTTLNDGSILMVLIMANPFNEALFLSKLNGISILGQLTETSISIFDREGGMFWDLTNDSLEFLGDRAQSVSSLETQRSGRCDHEACINTCMREKFPILSKIGTGLGILATGLCKCIFAPPPINFACVTGCLLSAGSLGISLVQWHNASNQCASECSADVNSHCCEGDEYFCRGDQQYILKCNKDTGRLSLKKGDDCTNPGGFIPPEDWCRMLGGFRPTGSCDKDTGKCVTVKEKCGSNSFCNLGGSVTCTARDPNIKYGPSGAVVAGQKLDYKIEFENEGEGIAFGVYFTDTLDEDLDESTRVIGEVKDVKTALKIGEPGTYNPATRTITWFVGNGGEVGPGKGGYADLSVNVRGDAPRGTEIINYGTVYFPSVPEETRTNAIVSIIPANEICDNGIDDDGDDLIDCADPECSGSGCVEVCDDGVDNDGDGFVDCADTDCPPCPEICDDGLDNDRDALIDCDDPDCVCCDSTNYSRGTSSITFDLRRQSRDRASLKMCVNRAFCDALRTGPKDIYLKLDGCNQITIPGSKLRPDRTKTRFSASSSTYTLRIDCRQGTLTFTLRNTALKDCVSNPVKMCVQIKDGLCLCAEHSFVERRDRKGNLIGLSLRVTGACLP